MFGPDVNAAIKSQAVAAWPRECCGLVIDGVYVPFPNIASDPMDSFRLPDDAWPIDGETVQAVLHSHCGPRWRIEPSAADMERQLSLKNDHGVAVPWGIVLANKDHCTDPLWFGDHVLDQPLLGRRFVHGVTDCYSVIRAYFWQEKKIKLPEFPRDVDWWKAGGNLYTQGFERAGFRQIDSAMAAPCDVVLIKIRSDVPNHGGVLLNNNLMLHHLQNRLSCRVPVGSWRKLITHWLRYEV